MKQLFIIKKSNDELIVSVARQHNIDNNKTTFISYGFDGEAMEWFSCEVLFKNGDMTVENIETYPEDLSSDAEELRQYMANYIDFLDEKNLAPIKKSCLRDFEGDACVYKLCWDNDNLCERLVSGLNEWPFIYESPFGIDFTAIWMAESFLQKVKERRKQGMSDSEIVQGVQDRFAEKGYKKPLVGLVWEDILSWSTKYIYQQRGIIELD